MMLFRTSAWSKKLLTKVIKTHCTQIYAFHSFGLLYSLYALHPHCCLCVHPRREKDTETSSTSGRATLSSVAFGCVCVCFAA